MSGQLFDAVMAFLLMVVLSRFTSKENFGIYSFILVLISLFSLSSLPGTATALSRSIGIGKKINFNNILKNNFKFSLIGSLLLILTASYYFFIEKNNEIFKLLILSSAFFPFLFSFGTLNGAYFIGKKKFGENALFTMLNSLFVTSLISLAVIFTDSVFYILLAYLLGTSIPNILIYIYLYVKVDGDLCDEKEVVDYAKFLTKMNFLNVVSTQIDQLILGFLVSKNSVADYRVITALSNTSKNLEKSLNNVLFSKFLDFKEADLKKYRARRILILLFAGIFISSILLVVQPFFIKVFFGENYENTIFLAEIMILTLVFLPLEIYFTQYFSAYKKNLEIKKTTIILPVVKLALTVGCYFAWGFNGVIISNVLARAFNVVFLLKISS